MLLLDEKYKQNIVSTVKKNVKVLLFNLVDDFLSLDVYAIVYSVIVRVKIQPFKVWDFHWILCQIFSSLCLVRV